MKTPADFTRPAAERRPAPPTAAYPRPADRRYRERGPGVGYGRSSGYADGRNYATAQRPLLLRVG